jgi:hypothetical protein
MAVRFASPKHNGFFRIFFIAVVVILAIHYLFLPDIWEPRTNPPVDRPVDQRQGDEDYFGTAFVISIKPVLSDIEIATAQSIGFRPRIVAALQPFAELYEENKETMLKECFSVDGKVMATTTLNIGEISLICTTRRIFEMITNDKSIPEDGWSAIIETDARLNPNAVNPKSVIQDAIDMAAADPTNIGFMYLGVCGGTCRQLTPDGFIGIDCNGACTHGYMITKKLARTFFADLYSFINGEPVVPYTQYGVVGYPQIDQAYKKWFDNTVEIKSSPTGKLRQALVIGQHLISPDDQSHTGLLYQCCREVDLHNSGTTLSKVQFKALTCYHMELTGRMGNLMFQYAALAGICVKNNFAADVCSHFLLPTKENLRQNPNLQFEVPTTEFFDTFGIVNSICPFPAVSYSEHPQASIYATEFDSNVFTQPRGTLFKGYFQSYKYFHPHATSFIRERFQFSHKIRRAASLFLQNIDPTNANKNIVCLSVRRGDKTNGKVYEGYDKWALSLDYYYAAIDYFVKKYGTIQLVVFTGGSLSPHSAEAKEDVLWTKKNFFDHFQNTTHVKVHTDAPISVEHLVTLQTLAMCPNNIVASSSFSWWGAFLAGHENVVAPRMLHNPQFLSFKPEDYYPPNWKLLQKRLID